MIYTFYSYKGGVGRSMALANVAEYFRRAGLRVVMVDWDLEAPGLEEYFWPASDELELVRAQVGVIDLLLEYMRLYPRIGLSRLEGGQGGAAEPGAETGQAVMEALRRSLRPLSESLFPVYPSEGSNPSGGGLWLLPSGMRFGEGFSVYARAVQTFDWRQFYAAFNGERYFEWMREQLDAFADVVLIDSRTGVTEMGGVCARQLADTVVSLCAPNQQNVEGVLRMSDSFTRPEVLEMRGRRPLDLVVVPTRLDASENDLMARFREEFLASTTRFVPEAFRRVGSDFFTLRIPYIPLYAYRERLAVGDPRTNADLEGAYRRLAHHLVLLAPEGSRIRRCLAPELNREFGGLLPQVAVVGGDAEEAARLRAAIRDAGSDVWTDFPGLASGGAALGDGAAVETAPVQHLVLVLPREPAGWARARAEWRAARRLGVCAHPVLPSGAPPLDLPAWLEDVRVYGPGEDEALLAQLRTPCRAVRVPCLAPPLPADLQPRLAASAELIDVMRQAGKTPMETQVVLAGLAGAGKTTLAQMACQDDRVNAAFPGGIYWIDGPGEPAVLHHLNRIYAARTGRAIETTQVDVAAERVRVAVGEEPYLLVLDDPSGAEAVHAFPPLGGRGCRLVVSRDRAILRDSAARLVHLGPMTAAESVALLLGDSVDASGEEALAAAPALAELAERVHHLPLGLRLVASQLRERQGAGQGLASAAGELVKRLRGPASDAPGADAPLKALEAALRPTLDALAPVDYARLARLASHSGAEQVGLGELEATWGGTPGERKDTALRLAALSLAELDAATDCIRVHPLVVDTVRLDSIARADAGVGAEQNGSDGGPQADPQPVFREEAHDVMVTGTTGARARWRPRPAPVIAAACLAGVLAVLFIRVGPGRSGSPPLATFADSLAALGSGGTDAGDRRALFVALSARSRDLPGANLSGLDLSQQNLAAFNLSNANLTGATLVNTRFDKATLSGAKLDSANLTGAFLMGAILSNATVRGARLDAANLRGADVTSVDLGSAVTTPLTVLASGLSGPYRKGEDAPPSADPADEDRRERVGVIWLGNYDGNRQAWEKPRLAGASLEPITKAPEQIRPRVESYRVLGDVTLRSTMPRDDAAYFGAVPALGWVPDNSTVTILEAPVAYDRTRFTTDGRIQYWARVRVDTVPPFLYVYYQDRANSDVAERVADALRKAGYSIRLIANRPNALHTDDESVRFFSAANAPRAAEVASLVKQVLEDNGVGGFTPRTNDRSGTTPGAQIEVWLPSLRRARS